MTTRLVLLCSHLLFSATPEAAADAEREAAREVALIDALRVIRAAASWLQARPQLGHEVFARPLPGPDPQVASYMALIEACLTVLRGGTTWQRRHLSAGRRGTWSFDARRWVACGHGSLEIAKGARSHRRALIAKIGWPPTLPRERPSTQ